MEKQLLGKNKQHKENYLYIRTTKDKSGSVTLSSRESG